MATPRLKRHRLYIDFETRSECDLKGAGAHKYAKHPSTDIICLGYAFDDEPVKVLGLCIPGGDSPPEDWDRIQDFVRNKGRVVAHNVAFEFALWNEVATRRYGWEPLTIEQCDCTMARAYAMALPATLEGSAAAVGLKFQKDMDGHRLMLRMCKPQPRTSDTRPTWHETEFARDRLFEYCRRDVEVERELDARLLPLQESERVVWKLDHLINLRGVPCDTTAAAVAIHIVDKEAERLDAEMRDVTGHDVPTCNAHIRLRSWINQHGVQCQGVGKYDVSQMLAKDDLPSPVRKALEIRKEAAKSSTAKLEAMLARVDRDGRMRGLFQYHGATTGRWAGRSVQLQNLPRPELEQEEIEEVFELMDRSSWEDARDSIQAFYGQPLSVISSAVRGFIRASPGRTFFAADFSSIEARVLAWLSGSESMLEDFRKGIDPYIRAASRTFRVPMDKVTKLMRQVGKVQVLALGYAGGVNALLVMCRSYGISLAPAFPELWRVASPFQRERAKDRYIAELKRAAMETDEAKKFMPPKEEWLACELTKVLWRDANPDIVEYWYRVEEAAMEATLKAGQMVLVKEGVPPVRFLKKGSFLLCNLPSWRNLCYPYPEVAGVKGPNGKRRAGLRYKMEHPYTKRWELGKTYGGQLVENIVQAVSRDCLVAAMVRAERAGYPVVMHVHDEVVAEPLVTQDYDDFLRIMTLPSRWNEGLPLTASGWVGERYRK